jgi:hypothetical protein
MHGSHSVTRIGEANIYVGLHWFYTQSRHRMLDAMSLRDLAAKEDVHFYAQNRFSVTDGESSASKDIKQYALVPGSKKDGSDIYCGASLISDFALESSLLSKGITTVFLYTDPEDNSSQSPVWLCAMNENGGLIEGQELLCESASHAVSLLDDLSLTDQIEFIIIDGDTNAKNIATSFLARIAEKPSDDKVKRINESVLLGFLPESNATIKRAYRPLPFKIEKAAIFAGAGALAVALYFGATYLSLSSYENQLESAKPLIDRKMAKYHEMMNDYKPSKYYDNHSFRADTLEQFSKSLQGTLYDPLTISLVLREINSTLPMNSAQWQLTKISYVNNRFLAFYNRRENGKGVYFLLDENIRAVNKMAQGIKITPFSLNDEGNTRVYNIVPVADVARQNLIDETMEAISTEGRLRNAVGRTIQEAAQHLRDMSGYITQYNQIGFLDKWVFRELPRLASSVEISLNEFSRIESSLEEAIKEKEAQPLFRLNESFILGNVMDFVTMLQLDSLFEWSYPQLKRTFPDKSSIEDRNKASDEGGPAYYKPAIESYRVEISTQESEEEGQLKSYGISDMIQLGFLLDKPFVNVEIVEYDRESEQWRWVINFNRKTSEYTRRFEDKQGS